MAPLILLFTLKNQIICCNCTPKREKSAKPNKPSTSHHQDALRKSSNHEESKKFRATSILTYNTRASAFSNKASIAARAAKRIPCPTETTTKKHRHIIYTQQQQQVAAYKRGKNQRHRTRYKSCTHARPREEDRAILRIGEFRGLVFSRGLRRTRAF